ncbi:hypothetical protein PCK1_000887 [Pneumocystis canis]|nr:hypothetical protein PCK1_000887 [Pneumocystis canis]
MSNLSRLTHSRADWLILTSYPLIQLLSLRPLGGALTLGERQSSERGVARDIASSEGRMRIITNSCGTLRVKDKSMFVVCSLIIIPFIGAIHVALTGKGVRKIRMLSLMYTIITYYLKFDPSHVGIQIVSEFSD